MTVCQNWVRHCPDADVQLQHVQMDYLRGIAMQDTNNPVLATYGIKALREYADNSHEFKDYLRALFHAHHKRCGAEDSSSSRLPILKQIGNEFQLRLRDGLRNENRIVFFRHAVNRRRVSAISGHERYMEWIANEY